MPLIDSAHINKIRVIEQAADPTAPDTGHRYVYAKADGIYHEDDAGSAKKLAEVTIATDNVSATPADAELDTAFGTPAEVGAGFIGVLDDGGTGTTVYLVASDGSNWWYAAMTKAT